MVRDRARRSRSPRSAAAIDDGRPTAVARRLRREHRRVAAARTPSAAQTHSLLRSRGIGLRFSPTLSAAVGAERARTTESRARRHRDTSSRARDARSATRRRVGSLSTPQLSDEPRSRGYTRRTPACDSGAVGRSRLWLCCDLFLFAAIRRASERSRSAARCGSGAAVRPAALASPFALRSCGCRSRDPRPGCSLTRRTCSSAGQRGAVRAQSQRYRCSCARAGARPTTGDSRKLGRSTASCRRASGLFPEIYDLACALERARLTPTKPPISFIASRRSTGEFRDVAQRLVRADHPPAQDDRAAPTDAAVDRTLPAARADRPRRDGQRLSRPRSEDQPHPRAQGHRSRGRLRPRGARDGEPRASCARPRSPAA